MKNILIRTAVSLGLIALLFYFMRNDIAEILQILKNVHKSLLLLAMGISFSTAFILSKRLQLIFEAEDVKLKISDALNLTFIGYFFNNFLPTSVGGDIVKVLCASRITQQPVKCVTSVLLDRIFGLFTFVLIPSVTLLFYAKQIGNPMVPILTYSLLLFSISFFVLLFNRGLARKFRFIVPILDLLRLREKIRQVYDGMNNFKNHQGVVWEAMLLSLIGQSINILTIYFMALALGAEVNVVYFYLLVPVVHLLSMLPSLGGLGIREGGYVYFLGPIIGREAAVALGILWLAQLLLMSLAGGIIYLVRHDYHVRFKEAAAS